MSTSGGEMAANYGKFDPNVDSIWGIGYCVENTRYGTVDQAMLAKQRGCDWVQCTDICLCTLINSVCIVFNVYLIAFIVKSQGWRKAMRHERFWMFSCTMIMNVCLLAGDTFNLMILSQRVRRALLILAWTLRSLCLILVCYYFFIRSRKLILDKDEQWMRKVQYWVWGAIGLAYLALILYFALETNLENDFVTSQKVDTLVCQSIMPILFDTLGLAIFVVMAIMAFMIKRAMERAQRL